MQRLRRIGATTRSPGDDQTFGRRGRADEREAILEGERFGLSFPHERPGDDDAGDAEHEHADEREEQERGHGFSSTR